MQQLLAEGVDGLDLQPARGLQRQGEQAPGAGQAGRRLADPGQLLGQGRIGHHRPAAQGLEQPALHLGRRRLGVGDAEDGLRVRAAQQQPRHPVDQRAGLARPGVGGDEGGGPRFGGQDLGVEAHSAASSPSPITCHSQTRARWS